MHTTAGRNRRLAVVMALSIVVGIAVVAVPVGPAAAKEQAVVRTGTVRVLHEDDFARKRSNHRLVLRADGKDYLLKGVDPASGPKSGATVRVAGAEDGSSIEVSDVTPLAPAPASAAAAPAPTGARETAVVLMNFANNAQRPFTTADALSRIFTGPDSTNSFYKESSNGSLSLVGRESAAGDVFGWYTIPHSNATCDPMAWADAARAAAAFAGHVLTAYDNVVYVFPTTPSCPWGGQAYIGTGPYGMGEAWSNGHLDTGLVSHELGHNLGMNHASTLACAVNGGRVTVAEGCTADEYGDPFDVMGDPWAVRRGGNGYGRQPHALHREQAGLMPASAATTVTASGDYTLAAGGSESGTRSLRLALDGLPGWYYYLELRAPEGRFDDFPTASPVVQGVSIRLSPDPWQQVGGTASRSYLLDATPDTSTFADAPLPVGRTFVDTVYGRAALTVKSVSGGVAVVHADLDIEPVSVAGAQPAPDATGVALDSNVVVTFPASMDRESVQNAFSLIHVDTPVPGAFRWDATSTVLTFDPSSPLLPRAYYTARIAAGGRDASGRYLTPWRSTFLADGPSPKVVAVDPLPETRDVPVDRNVSITFQAPVDRASAQAAFGLYPAFGFTSLGGTFTWDATSTVMTFNPWANLAASSYYRVGVAHTVKDAAGNSMVSAFASGFTTDAQAPFVAGIEPADDTTGVAVNRNVSVTFSEPVERYSAQTAFSLRKAGTTVNLTGAFGWNAASTVMTFDPYANLAEAGDHTVAIAPSVKDVAGNIMASPFASTFTTDGRAPSVTTVDPAAGTTAVAVDRNLVFTFSEPVERYSAQTSFSLRKSGTTANLGGSFTWNVTSTVMTFDPYANLLANSEYAIAVAASAKDVAGNPMDGAFASTFTTDAHGPTVTAVDAGPGATAVAVDRNVVVTFSEPVERSSAQSAFSLRRTGTMVNLSGAFGWNAASTAMTFDPYANLTEASGHTIFLSATVKDVAGNTMTSPHSSTFTTDGQAPMVTTVDPATRSTEVAVDRNLVVTFSEPVERNSAQVAFALRKAGTTVNLGGSFAWNAASTVMTFDPYANLAANSGYTAAVSMAAKDVAGTPLAFAFESTLTTDAQAPAVSGTDPGTGATGMAVDGNVVVTFSEPVERNSAQAAFSLRRAGTTVNLGGGVVWNAASTVMTFDPYANLSANSEYSIGIAASVKDLAGNPMAASFASTFASDAQGPTVTAVDAGPGATAVAVDRNVVVTFSEPVERSSAQSAFSLRRTGTMVNLSGAFGWNPASTVMTFDPYANLPEASGHTIFLSATVKDVAGNTMTSPHTSTFTTDGQAPMVTTVDPATRSTEVAVDRNLVVTFSEPVERNSAQVAFALRKAGTTVNLGGSFAWNAASTVMTFDPYANLAANSGYTAAVSMAAKDVAGTPLAFAFESTLTTDAQAPAVSRTDPGAGATGIAVDGNVVVTFSEPVDRNSAQAAFSLRRAGTTVNLGGGVVWNAASTVMTFDPYANLSANSEYSIGIAASVKDLAGNPMAAPFASTFSSDGRAPWVTTVDPAIGTMGVAVDRNVVVTFSEPVERNSAQAAFSLRKSGTTANLGGYFAWNVASTVMTFDPYANLLANSEYAIAVATSAKDVAGNPMAAAFASTFTSDAEGPSVTVDPAAAATGVAVARNVVMTFSEPVERNSAQAAFSLRKTGTTVNLGGNFAWNAASTVMTFDPYANLSEASGYTVAMAATVRDLAGNVIASPVTSTFTTDGRAPTVSTADPATGSIGVAVDRSVVVTFSEPMERNSAQAAFSLRKAGTTTNLGGYLAWNAASTIMTFDPYANLLANSGYSVAVSLAAKDVVGTPLAAAFESSFTSDAQAPTVTTVDPAAGTTGVAVDRNIVVTFSEPVERSSAQAAFSLRTTGATVNLGGSLTWDVTGTVMTFNPYANLVANTGYTVAVAASVKDVAGNPMAAAVGSAFQTKP